jgi:multidrug resistance protein
MALTIFIDFAGFGIVLPLLPFWAERLGAGAVGVGLILTIYALAQFIFTPVLGTLSDRYGRRPIILASLLIEALSALASSFAILLVARFIGGLGASNIGSAQAVVADVTPIERRARGMGLIGAAIGLGFVVGPAMGGLLAHLGPAIPFWVAMIVALANALLVLRFLPETHHKETACATVPFTHRGMGGVLAGGGGYCGIQRWHDWWSLTCSSPLPLPQWRQSSRCLLSIPSAGKPSKTGTSSPMQVSLLCSCRVVWSGDS